MNNKNFRDSDSSRRPRVVLVLPAYNAEPTLAETVAAIPPDSFDLIILVDDGSSDRTVETARELGISVISHDRNLGYGANQKTCYRAALDAGADIVVMLHPDNQYDPRCIPIMTRIVELGICDVVMGSRIRSRRQALAGGMPLWKYLLNRSSTFAENLILGTSLGDFHSGFRTYRREVLEAIPFEENSDDFAFDQEFIFQARYFGFDLGDIPVPTRYFDRASSISFRRAMRYGLGGVSGLLALALHISRLRTDPRFVRRD